MFSNHLIIIDKVERHEDYVRHIFRDLLSGKNSKLNGVIKRENNYWEKKGFLA